MRLIGLSRSFSLSASSCTPHRHTGAQPQAGKVYRIGYLQAIPDTPDTSATQRPSGKGCASTGTSRAENVDHRVPVCRRAPAERSRPVLRPTSSVAKSTSSSPSATPALLAAQEGHDARSRSSWRQRRPGRRRVWSRAWRGPAATSPGLHILTDELELKNASSCCKEAVPEVARVAVLWNPDNPVWPLALKRLAGGGSDARCDRSVAGGAGSRRPGGSLRGREQGRRPALSWCFANGSSLCTDSRSSNFVADASAPGESTGSRFSSRMGGLIVYAA